MTARESAAMALMYGVDDDAFFAQHEHVVTPPWRWSINRGDSAQTSAVKLLKCPGRPASQGDGLFVAVDYDLDFHCLLLGCPRVSDAVMF